MKGRTLGILAAVMAVVGVVAAAPMIGLLVIFMAASAPASAAPALVPGIDPVVLSAYSKAITELPKVAPHCSGLSWTVLAGIGQVESNNAAGRQVSTAGDVRPEILGPALDGSGVGGNTVPIYDANGGYARAVGPMQFMSTTWATAGQDGNGDGTKDPHNIFDAALAAAGYLCGQGPVDLSQRPALEAAIFRYNNSRTYVAEVLSWASQFAQYDTGTPVTSSSGNAIVQAGMTWLGVPYVWGGGRAMPPAPDVAPFGPTARPDITHDPSRPNLVGFDCSGFTRAAVYKATGRVISSVAIPQAYDGLYIPPSAGLAALREGDLVFFAANPNDRQTIYHVGIYVGGGQMLSAPNTGAVVRVEPVWLGSYAGGMRLQ